MNSTYFTRRTIRKYEEREIDDVLLGRILTAGTRSSTTGNMQVYLSLIHFSALTSRYAIPYAVFCLKK